MKTQVKSVARMFKKHLAGFLSMLFIVFVSIGFISGLGTAADQLRTSLSKYYASQNVSDFILKSRSQSGFSEEDIQKIKGILPDADIESGVSLDVKVAEKGSVRLNFVDFDNITVNLFDIIEGNAPSSEEILAESSDEVIEKISVGDTFTLNFYEVFAQVSQQNGESLDEQTASLLKLLPEKHLKVSGIVQSPLNFVLSGDPSFNNPQDTVMPDTTVGVKDMDLLFAVYYIPKSVIPTYRDILSFIPDDMNGPVLKNTDIYIAVKDRTLFKCFSKEYLEKMNVLKAEIKQAVPNCEVITLEDNYSFKSLSSYSDKLSVIGFVIMAAFLLVTMLVVFSSMTRLLDEERPQIACLVTLGYSPAQILFKYLLFALTATAIGGFGAHFLSIGISNLVYTVFGASYVMPPVTPYVAPVFYFIVLAVIVLGTLFVTAIAGAKMTCGTPTDLLRPKTPRAGKKVFLEKFRSLWKRIPFKYKSTFRNLFRYLNRFLMSVISIAFSTGLVLAGLALLDLCIYHLTGTAAIVGISVIIILFAGLLTAVVIYTLTNISISERNREIATLMVLGYGDREVTGYIYREIYINSAIGIVFGFPVGALLSKLLYDTIGLGTVGGISWFMWLSAPLVVILFTFLVTLILNRKILSVDMNKSLKAIE